MDRSETIAKKYLESLSFKDVIFEPDGNIPPDFLCDQKVAVEVRRLNQHKETPSGKFKGLDETSIPFLHRLQNELKNYGPSLDSISWFVLFKFSRPIEKWKTLRPKIKESLKAFKYSETEGICTISISPTFELELVRASEVKDDYLFAFGGISDTDSGGWLLQELQKNLQIVIDEKTEKISRVRHKYPEWWLVLLDHIGFSLSDIEREIFEGQIESKNNWDKIVLLDPRDGERAYEI